MMTPPNLRAQAQPTGAEAARPQPGRGTRMVANDLVGYAVSTPAPGVRYPHPFKPALSGAGMVFSRGLVESYEPTIEAQPIGGGEAGIQPVLKLDPGVANKKGESWCCLEVVPNAKGQVDEKSRVEMVHTKTPYSEDPAVGRCPVALVLWQARVPVAVHEILFFNVRYQRVTMPPNQGPPRHLFF